MDRIAGRIPVLECLRARRRKAQRLLILHGAKDLDAILEAAHHAAVPVEQCSRTDLDHQFPETIHQGVVLLVNPLPILSAEEWIKRSHPSDEVVIILDSVEDPHNFGAIVRSAAACGASAVIFGKDRSAPISPVSVKSAAGAMEYIDLIQATNIVRTLKGMKDIGFWIAGLDEEGPQTIWDIDLSGRVGLVIGNEGKGIRRLVRETCDFLVRIPIQGPITSLNASVSAGIILAECLRRRTGKT